MRDYSIIILFVIVIAQILLLLGYIDRIYFDGYNLGFLLRDFFGSLISLPIFL